MKQNASYRKSKQLYKAFNEALASFDDIGPAVIGLTSSGEIVYVNHSACDLFDYPKDDLEGLQIQALAPGMTAADWSSFWSGLNQEDSKPARTTLRLSDKKALSIEFRALFNHPSGVKYCLMTRPGKNPAAGVKRGTPGRPLDLVLNSMAEPVIVQDEQYKITFLNQAACQALGTTVAKAAGTTVYDYMPESYAKLVRKNEQKVLASGRPIIHVGDEFLRAKYGESATTLLFLDPGTSRKRLLVIVNRPLQTAYLPPMVKLGTAELVPGRPISGYLSEVYELLENGTPLGIYLKDTENRLLWVNHAFARIAGFEPKDFIGKRVDDVLSDPELIATLREDDNYIYATGNPHFNRTIRWFGDPSRYFRIDRVPFINRKGEVAGIIGLVVELDEPPPPAEALKQELAATSKKLSETETALRVLLERREQDLSLTREELSVKLREQILPYLEHLKQAQLTPEQAEFVELIETNLKNFYDPAYARLSSPSCKLSPTELKVAQLIRDGKTNKEIAKLLHLSKSTILTHRHHVRVKLGIRNKKVNLRSLLSS